MELDKLDLWKIGANCTDFKNCKKAIPNSDCFAGFCKCIASYGPSPDKRKCRKSKKFGSSCHPSLDACYMEKLYCDPNSNLCQCAPGYRYDSSKNDCFWFYYCEDGLIWDGIRHRCIKPSDYWFPTSNHNPKLSFITFILLVFCFIKVMRSNPYVERRRRISTNINRESFDFLSTMLNSESNNHNNQRYSLHSDTNRNNIRNHMRRSNDNQEIYFDEDQAPPAYEEIINDLKAVTVINNNNNTPIVNDTTYITNQEDIELKEINQVNKFGQQPDQIINIELANQLNDNLYASTNHIESQSTSSSAESSLENTLSNGQELINNNRNLVSNSQSENSSNESTGQSNNQSIVHSNLRSNVHSDNVHSNLQSNNSSTRQFHDDRSNIGNQNQDDQLNNSEDQLPTYQQAISKMPSV